ncbi:Immunoglobulin G-binding protein [Salix suchowensis]|nr:Immunoglobulin G-binding protein [Salix suchowensis]
MSRGWTLVVLWSRLDVGVRRSRVVQAIVNSLADEVGISEGGTVESHAPLPDSPAAASPRQHAIDLKLTVIGDIQDRISNAHRELDTLSSSTARPGAKQIIQLLKRIKVLRTQGVQLETDLRLAKKRTRKSIAAQTLHTETQENLRMFTLDLNRLEKRLHRIQEEYLDERMRRESDPAYFNTDYADTYPELCTTIIDKTSMSLCGERLCRAKKVGKTIVQVPIKPYIVFDFKNWLASLLSRPGYENMMDDAWDRMKIPPDGKIDNILQGEIPRTFLGPDGQHFSKGGTDGVTSFPYVAIGLTHSRTRWANLPAHLKHRPENVFVFSIMPGPTEPKYVVNPYLKPLVKIFLLFWDTGVHFSRTCKFPTGALSCVQSSASSATYLEPENSAASQLVPTLLLRHMFMSTPGSIKHSIDIDVDQLQCPSFRLRYTELLELPYFDPTRFIVVDSMHNLFLGLIKEHFTNILGYNPKAKETEDLCDVFPYAIEPSESNPLPSKESEQTSVDKLLLILQHPFSTHPASGGCITLKSITWRTEVCLQGAKAQVRWFTYKEGNSGKLRRRSCELAENVNVNVARNSDIDLDGAIHGQVFSKSDIETLWEDIRNTSTPSWLSSVPSNLGNHTGKLKADQWRTAATVYYPITLLRLWSWGILQVHPVIKAVTQSFSRFPSPRVGNQYSHLTGYVPGTRKRISAIHDHVLSAS